jgi:hypothetical protein
VFILSILTIYLWKSQILLKTLNTFEGEAVKVPEGHWKSSPYIFQTY